MALSGKWEEAAWGVMLLRGVWQARSLPGGEWTVWRGGSIATRGHAESTEDGVARCEEAIQALTVEHEKGAGSALEMLRAKWREQKRRQKDRRDETERNSADL